MKGQGRGYCQEGEREGKGGEKGQRRRREGKRGFQILPARIAKWKKRCFFGLRERFVCVCMHAHV